MERVGELAYLLRFRSREGPAAALRRLLSAAPPRVADLVPGALTLLVELEAAPWTTGGRARTEELLSAVEAASDGQPDAASEEGRADGERRLHAIEVRYDGEDLPWLAERAGLGVQEVVALHASATYRVAFLGFQPGFAYLDGLPEALRAPRLETPRRRVRAGSVAIGGEWTGIYPSASPGGWRLIGTAEVRLFDPRASPPAVLAPGDRLRFAPR